MDDQEPQKPRRVRYNGTHPKSFKEKYKELQPENYSADVAKIIEQGKHEDLLDTKGLYYAMWRQQIGERRI